MNDYQHRRQMECKKLGLCVSCGPLKAQPAVKRNLCLVHFEQHQSRTRALRAEKKFRGLCSDCPVAKGCVVFKGGRCEACYAKHFARQHIYANSSKGKQAFRAWRDRTTYGLAPGATTTMLQEQSGVCAICLKPESKQVKGVTQPLSIDHDHRTGKIRGLLCSPCNLGLGLFQEDPDLLIEAARYLEKL